MKLFWRYKIILCKTYTLRKEKKLSSLFYLMSLTKNLRLSSITVVFLNLSSITANLHIIHKTFKFSHASIDKSKFETHPRFIVIIERFQNRTNVNARTSNPSQSVQVRNFKLVLQGLDTQSYVGLSTVTYLTG